MPQLQWIFFQQNRLYDKNVVSENMPKTYTTLQLIGPLYASLENAFRALISTQRPLARIVLQMSGHCRQIDVPISHCLLLCLGRTHVLPQPAPAVIVHSGSLSASLANDCWLGRADRLCTFTSQSFVLTFNTELCTQGAICQFLIHAKQFGS